MLFDKSVRNKKSVKSACGKGKKSVKAAESYGWVVESWEAAEAYDLAAEYFGVEDINQQIVDCISSDELAACLAYIFRMNDFREWDERNEDSDEDDEDIEESVRAKGRKSVKASRKTNRKPVKASKLRKGRSKKSIKAARLTIDFGQYKPWSGAVDTWENLERFDKIDLLEQILDDTYYDETAGEAVLSETELNDLLWFEPETVYEWVGLYYDDSTGEVSDEPFDNDYDEDDEIEESVRAKGRKSVKASSKPLSTSEKKACIDQIAYDYGVSKKQATEWYNSYSDERRRLILDGGKASAKKSFYND